MSMFKIKNSEDITLDGNKTNGDVMADLENVKNLTARNNEAYNAMPPTQEEEILTLRPGVYGISLNLKALWKKIFK